MALLKVFISSTCYDLSMVRAELRDFITNLGHDPIMSDYNDILYDPKDHTHESCIKEIPNSDAVIVIIGSRFGGKAIPKAISSVDLEKLKGMSKDTKIFENPENISISQLEILKAIESNIPIFTFVESKVLYNHHLFEKNKDNGNIDTIIFPNIDKNETAVYIFEFINFLRYLNKNNSILEFNDISDIKMILKKQWSALLQRLLFEQRSYKNEKKMVENVSKDLNESISQFLSTIITSEAKELTNYSHKLSVNESNRLKLVEVNRKFTQYLEIGDEQSSYMNFVLNSNVPLKNINKNTLKDSFENTLINFKKIITLYEDSKSFYTKETASFLDNKISDARKRILDHDEVDGYGIPNFYNTVILIREKTVEEIQKLQF